MKGFFMKKGISRLPAYPFSSYTLLYIGDYTLYHIGINLHLAR